MSQFETLKKAASSLGGSEGFALLKLLAAIEANGNASDLDEYMALISEVELNQKQTTPNPHPTDKENEEK